MDYKKIWAFAGEYNLTYHVFIGITKSLTAGTLLSRIAYWFSPRKDGTPRLTVQKNGQFWLAKTRTDWKKEIMISEYEYDGAVKILKELGLVETKIFKFNGTPMTHIRIIEENLNAAIDEYMTAKEAEVKAQETPDESSQNGGSKSCEESQSNDDLDEELFCQLQDDSGDVQQDNGSDCGGRNMPRPGLDGKQGGISITSKVGVRSNPKTLNKEYKQRIHTNNNIEMSNDIFGLDGQTRPTGPKTLIMDAWNSLPEPVPKIRSIESNRVRMIKARLKTCGGMDEFIKVIESIRGQPFLLGQRTNFIISFDWFIKPTNFVKVMELNYADNARQAGKEPGERVSFAQNRVQKNQALLDRLKKQIGGES